jgi:polyisoprenoid-binding protein YceI
MRNRTVTFVIALFATLALGVSLVAQTSGEAKPVSSFRVDTVHSMANFRVQHLGAGMFWGRFDDVQGSITFNEQDADGLSFDISIGIESVHTGNDQLNGHLKSPDFFNAREWPRMSFKSTDAKKTGAKTYDVTGRLTIRDVTKTVTVPIEFTGAADMGRGVRVGFEATFKIMRDDYGVSYGVENGSVGNETGIIVTLEGIKQ